MTSSPPSPVNLAQALFEEATDALFLFEPESDRLADVNPAALRLTGFARQDILAFPATNLFRLEGGGGRQQLRAASRTSGIGHLQDDFLLRCQQEGVWVPVSLTLSRLHVNPRTLALITARDVRQQRETLTRLRGLETEMGQLMASVNACLWSAEIDAQGRWEYRYWSTGVEGLTGRPPAFYFAGPERWADVVHADDRPAWNEALAGFRAGWSGQHEYRVLLPDGNTRWVRESVTATPRDAGHVRLDAVVTDVTDRRRAEDALSEQRAMLQNIITHIPCAVFWKDRDSVYLGCSEKSARDLGLGSPEQVIGKTDFDMPFTRQEAEFYRSCDRQVMETGQPLLNIEETQHRRDGKLETLLTSKVPLRDADGTVIGLLGFYTDITERKQLEEQFRQAQKMEAVGRLAGGIAHDFNNLLTIINGYSELLLADPALAHASRELIAEIGRAGDRAAALTRQLLAFSRKQILNPQVLNLNDLVSEMEKMLRRLIGEDVQLATVLAAGLGRVKADRVHFQQVLLNLVVNARDAMPQGGRITIETANVDLDAPPGQGPRHAMPGRYVLLAVRDTGVGMDEQTRAHLFEPFFTTKEQGRGTGLGLAMVYGTVQQSGGLVDVESTPGRGTTFRLYLPRVRDSSNSADAVLDQARLPGGSETVLLAEDEDGVRTLAATILRAGGYRVLEARDGTEAITVCRQNEAKVDLLVTDLVMPGMSGRQLADALQPMRPGLKVLFMSGHTEDAVLRHGGHTSGRTLLQKPFTRAGLTRTVREVLDAKRA
jgi:two-component system cell cycle sensor histidine kinase/response regulator CckA